MSVNSSYLPTHCKPYVYVYSRALSPICDIIGFRMPLFHQSFKDYYYVRSSYNDKDAHLKYS